MQPGVIELPIRRIQGAEEILRTDILAVEEPLAIRVGNENLSVTMRTPGHDFELVVGFLFSEGLIRSREDILEIRYCAGTEQVVRVELKQGVNLKKSERYSVTNSSCGVCGKTSIESVKEMLCRVDSDTQFSAELIHSLPDILGRAQNLFSSTGGIHASCLIEPDGEVRCLREDVGRHNAMDKVIGRAVLDGQVPLSSALVMVSGRASFELVQKASRAGIAVLAAVGAPSSLAVQSAQAANMTLVGFVRNGRFNIYCGDERIRNYDKSLQT